MKHLILVALMSAAMPAHAEDNWTTGGDALHQAVQRANRLAKNCLENWQDSEMRGVLCNGWLTQLTRYNQLIEFTCGSDEQKQQVCFYNLFTDQQRQLHLDQINQLHQRSSEIRDLYQAQ